MPFFNEQVIIGGRIADVRDTPRRVTELMYLAQGVTPHTAG